MALWSASKNEPMPSATSNTANTESQLRTRMGAPRNPDGEHVRAFLYVRQSGANYRCDTSPRWDPLSGGAIPSCRWGLVSTSFTCVNKDVGGGPWSTMTVKGPRQWFGGLV